MQISSSIQDILSKVLNGLLLTRADIVYLLKMNRHSMDAGLIMAAANTISREAAGGRAEVHAQIGLNLAPCPKDCSFCSFAASNGVFKQRSELPVEDVVRLSLNAEAAGANALFFMATGDYPLGKYIETSKEVRAQLKSETVMIANIGDFEYAQGKQLKEAGFTGIYHAVRMGEGKDTRIDPQVRLKSIKSAREAGLLVGTCVEPIGPEHTVEEITEKILVARELNPCYSGAGRRIDIPNSPLQKFGMISEYHMAYLVAVVRLAMGRELIGNCTHEPNLLGASAGANLFWAEAGANPRDTAAETAKGRGLDVNTCIRIFKEVDWDILQGPSVIYSESNKKVG